MGPQQKKLAPAEQVLSAIYGKTSLETGISEKRRDEVIAAAIYTCFRNQEFGTRFQLPANFRGADETEDARGIDMIVQEPAGRTRQLQIKGIYIQRSIVRRMNHKTRGAAHIYGMKARRQIERDSAELTRIMKDSLDKIIQDYSGIVLIIHVIADLATQTSLNIALRNCRDIVSHLKAKEVWFLRHIPVRILNRKRADISSHTYKLMKIVPERQTYCFSFAF
jgi:hypothetical protein